ncbi:MAG TPA: DJ-1/PfpI family protein [Actinomycetota bacterium]|nr:DJ-1/PfpI family protein [Actinomycetota bacterium]
MPLPEEVFTIGIPIYEAVDLLDVVAGTEMFGWMGDPAVPGSIRAEVRLIAEQRSPVRTLHGTTLLPDAEFKDVPQLDMLWVPGGYPDVVQTLMKGGAYLDFLVAQAADAKWVTSVCIGALLLASAGLLDGYEATTHWEFIPCLKLFPNVRVADGNPRFVRDRNRFTGGGISAGLDGTLALIEVIAGTALAEQVQVVTQYFPDPPVSGSIPAPDPCPWG